MNCIRSTKTRYLTIRYISIAATQYGTYLVKGAAKRSLGCNDKVSYYTIKYTNRTKNETRVQRYNFSRYVVAHFLIQRHKAILGLQRHKFLRDDTYI